MEIVEPIRDMETIQEFKDILKAKSYRDYLFFVIGVNSALRISDILKLKVKDVRGKTHLELKETKTRKRKLLKLNKTLINEFEFYTRHKDDDEWLIQSTRKPKNPKKPEELDIKGHLALDRFMAYEILNKVAKQVGIQGRIGTHTLRKTYGYHFYQKTKDLEGLRQLLNHSESKTTRLYIGINQDYLDKATSEFDL